MRTARVPRRLRGSEALRLDWMLARDLTTDCLAVSQFRATEAIDDAVAKTNR